MTASLELLDGVFGACWPRVTGFPNRLGIMIWRLSHATHSNLLLGSVATTFGHFVPAFDEKHEAGRLSRIDYLRW